MLIALKISHKADNISLEPELNAGACRAFPLDKQGHFQNRILVAKRLEALRPDLGQVALEEALNV